MENLSQESINNYENGQSSMEVHTIGGYQTTVGVADSARLSDLNDECMETIFSLQFISITDLCEVARTNHRLMNVANRIFSLNHKTCNIRSLVNRVSDAKRVIVTFGYLISDLWISGDFNYNRHGMWWVQWDPVEWTWFLNLVIVCCKETLDTLHIDQCFIPESLTSGLKILFNNLKKLCITSCKFQGSEDLFTDCKNLVELTVYGEDLYLNHVFPKLERFHYEDGDLDNLAIFLPRHKNLKSLNILGWWDCLYLLPMLAINCTQLEKLTVNFGLLFDESDKNGNVIGSLQMLAYLRTLIIHCLEENYTEFIPKLNSLKSLEVLELWYVRDECTSAISQLKRLNVLRLMFCRGLMNLIQLADITPLTELSILSDDNIKLDIVLLVKQLNSLNTLNIHVETYKLDKKMYINLVTVVRNRPLRSQQSLEIGCFIAEDAVAEIQNGGYNRQIVKLKIRVNEVGGVRDVEL